MNLKAAGQTALHMAARRGHAKSAELLIINGANINAKTATGVTPLHGAVINGNKETVDLLIANGANINAKNKSGKPPLYYSRTYKVCKEITDLLHKHGAKTAEELKTEEK